MQRNRIRQQLVYIYNIYTIEDVSRKTKNALVLKCFSLRQSHPRVGVSGFGPKVFDQLSSLSEELPVRMNILRVHSFWDYSAYTCRSGGTNKFPPSFGSGKILSSYCEGFRNVWCAPTTYYCQMTLQSNIPLFNPLIMQSDFQSVQSSAIGTFSRALWL